MFYSTEQTAMRQLDAMAMAPDIEILIDEDFTIFSWNDEAIQDLAEELGKTEFAEPRPCG